MPTKMLSLATLLTTFAILAAGCSFQAPQKQAPRIVGNDRDAHDCIGSAGYSWCELKQRCLRPWEEACENASATPTVITYLVSEEDPLKYCNGGDMDSIGYKKTITTELSTTTPKTNLSEEELAKETVLLATSGLCREAMRQIDFKIIDGVVRIPPIEGWAGISIAMCSCQPQVEVNLLQVPGIKLVVW
jgi:hypothetical protein